MLTHARTHRPNAFVADKLREGADLLEQQAADRFRIAAYRRAADTVERCARGLDEILREQGLEGLTALPGIGRGIAAAVEELLRTGRWSKLERLRGQLDPVRLFQAVPGIGPQMARHIHDTLHVDTLEALELAAHDGRLAEVPGVGPRRAAAIRANLSALLGRPRRYLPRAAAEPPVSVLLEVDREYVEAARHDLLPKIAPKRFNPKNEAWLPILHTAHGEWHFTALFSNTARAHELHRTRDWVVIYYYDGHHEEGQNTVVTESRGPLAGRRVVRGREHECRLLYEESAEAGAG